MPIAQHASVDVTSATTVAGRLAGVVAPGLWQCDARRSTRQPARQTTVCDERRFTTCLISYCLERQRTDTARALASTCSLFRVVHFYVG